MSVTLAVEEAETAGRRSVERCREQPAILGRSEIGAFSANSRAWALALRRVLLTLGVLPGLLAWVPLARLWPSHAGRWGVFLRRYAYWYGVRSTLRDRDIWRRLTRGPVILMYHAVGRPDERASRYVVPLRRFRRQMAWLRWRGYRVIGLADLVSCLRDSRLPPARSVVITFDDGYADNCDLALPVLRRCGFPATVFLVTGAIGDRATWTDEPGLAGRPILSEAQVRQMLQDGIDVGAHTRTHPSLPEVAVPDQEDETRGAFEDLARRFGPPPVRMFAYPYGDYDLNVAQLVQQAGFDAACCSRSGVNDPATSCFELRRVEVCGTDALWLFALLVWRGRRRRRRAAGRPAVPEVEGHPV